MRLRSLDLGMTPTKPYPAAMRDGKSDGRIDVLCVGGAVIDRTYRAHRILRPGTSNPAAGSQAFGGVARNVAVNLARLGVRSGLVSVIGEDPGGQALVEDLARLGIDTSGLRRVAGARTAEYLALIEPDGTLALGVADMAILDDLVFEDVVRAPRSAWLFADCNAPAALLAGLMARGDGRRLAVDAVSTPKVERLPNRLDGLDLLFLNRDEAAALLGRDAAGLDAHEACLAIQGRGCGCVVLTLGVEGLVFAAESGEPAPMAALPTHVVDVTGAGDALIAGTLAGLVRGETLHDALRLGTAAAALTLGSAGSTSACLSFDELMQIVRRGAASCSPQ